jgi:hypothetical protein
LLGDLSAARTLANALAWGPLGPTFGETIKAYPVGTVCSDTQALLQAFGTPFGETVGTYPVGTVCGDTQALLLAFGTPFGETVGTYPIGSVFSDTQTLLQAFGSAFGQRAAAKTDKRFNAAVLGFAKQRLWVALWQGECASGQAGQEQCGDHLLFHVQAPREGGK